MALKEVLSGAAVYTHLGLTLALTVLLGFFGGYWLDGKLGTGPLFTLAGAFIGAAGGFINLVRTLTRNQAKEGEVEESDEKPSR